MNPRPSSTSMSSSLSLMMMMMMIYLTTLGEFFLLQQEGGSVVKMVYGFQQNIALRRRPNHNNNNIDDIIRQRQQQQQRLLRPNYNILLADQPPSSSFDVIVKDDPAVTSMDTGSVVPLPVATAVVAMDHSTSSSSSSSSSSTTNNDTNHHNNDLNHHTNGVGTIGSSATPAQPHVPFLIVLWRFTRPHTLIGSALAIPALHLLAAPTWSSIWTRTNLFSIAYATIPSLLMNLYITGLNQITDVEIDKINKPNLPIAAGILKQRDAIITCIIALFVSLYMGTWGHAIYSTRGLQVALWGSGILGTLYSLEPFRLKRYPLLAAFCIVAVRGTIINASFFAHAMAAVFQQPSATVLSCLRNDPRCLFSSIFFGIFGIVIALMKDVPDVLGDKWSNVRTFSVRVGPTRIFHASRKLLMGLFYVCTVGFVQRAVIATTTPLAACRSVVAIACFAAAISIRQQSKVVDPTNPKQVYEYYMHLWKIFYMSYLLLPLAR